MYIHITQGLESSDLAFGIPRITLVMKILVICVRDFIMTKALKIATEILTSQSSYADSAYIRFTDIRQRPYNY